MTKKIKEKTDFESHYESIISKIKNNSWPGMDEFLLLQALVFNEFRKSADRTAKKQFWLTLFLLLANLVLAATATITVLCR